MTRGNGTYVYPVRDLTQAKALFERLLGTEPYVDAPTYVGFRLGEQEVGLNPNAHAQGITTPVCYWHVENIEGAVGQLRDAGAEIRQEIRDVGNGRRIALAADPDGNLIGVLQDP